ncbi:hypothetical protein HR45_03600 [Shewanella mangrovi]|uniref:Diguanylate phosphodiesterase n=1 Tax=Shewanella mangrovi TaxID=1515746 RepID=A0A094JF21_9GAMM|nr:EAL domain-containing protein [Shewanella mangrovi]KFZ38525.1 hypothetical protein HR45_03600 [Shewanella mangrovi]
MEEELFQFAQEAETTTSFQLYGTWKVLSVEDDQNYQASLMHTLNGYYIKGRPIQMLTADNAVQAAEIIASTPDLAVALLDVVMEDDEAGLRLVNTIRQVLGNDTLRVILLTGQPGMAPFVDVMQQYDIDEYWQKTEISSDKIRSVVAANIRTWHAYCELENARKSLSLVVEASRELSRLGDVNSYANLLLQKVREILDASVGGIICAQEDTHQATEQYKVISCSGSFTTIAGNQLKTLGDIPDNYLGGLTSLIKQCQMQRRHQFLDKLSVLFFATDKAEGESNFIMVVESLRPLSAYHINLLQVFSENVSNGFNNILLCNRLSELAYYDSDLKIPNRAWLLRFIDSLTEQERQDAVLLAFTIRDYHDLVLSISGESFSSVLYQFYLALSRVVASDRHIARVNDDCFTVMLSRSDLQDRRLISELDHFKIMADRIQLHIEVNSVLMELSLLENSNAQEVFHLLSSTIQYGRKTGAQFIEYSPEMRGNIVARHQLLQGLNEAIDSGELLLVFQPKVRLRDLAVCGFEALLRWRKANGDLVPPGAFIPVAEMSGLINKVDHHVYELTLVALKQLIDAGIALPVSFNVTVSDLEDDAFVDEMLSFAIESPSQAKLLEIEITESQAMDDYQRVAPVLKQLMGCGIGVNIDDFGTGYSSLKHITELGATHLKIDRAFIDAMMKNSAGEDVVEVIIKLGQRFNFTVIAEGVETEAQRKKLLQLGCEIAQGYLFAKPMELSSLLTWLKDKTFA